MKKAIVLIFFLTKLVSCKESGIAMNQKQVRLENQTQYCLNNIFLFEESLESIPPYSKSNIVKVNFELDSTEPILSFSVKNEKFIRLVYPISSQDETIIVVDSINFDSNFISVQYE